MKSLRIHLSYLYLYDNCATNQTTRSRLYLSPGRNVSSLQCEIEVQHVLETFNTYPADCWSQNRAFTILTGLAEKPTPTKAEGTDHQPSKRKCQVSHRAGKITRNRPETTRRRRKGKSPHGESSPTLHIRFLGLMP